MSTPEARSRLALTIGDHQKRIRKLEAVNIRAGQPSYAYCFSYVTPESVAQGGSLRLSTEDFYTNALDTVFSTGGVTTPHENTTGDLYLHFHAAGLYLVYGDAFWDNTSNYVRDIFVDTTCVIFNQQEIVAEAMFADYPGGSGDPLQERPIQYNFVDQYTLDNSPTYYHRVSMLAYNRGAVGAQDVLYHTLAAVYWPMTSDFQNTPNSDLVYESGGS